MNLNQAIFFLFIAFGFLSCSNTSLSQEHTISIDEKEYDDFKTKSLKGTIPMPTHVPELNDSTFYIYNSQRDNSSILKEWLEENYPK